MKVTGSTAREDLQQHGSQEISSDASCGYKRTVVGQVKAMVCVLLFKLVI